MTGVKGGKANICSSGMAEQSKEKEANPTLPLNVVVNLLFSETRKGKHYFILHQQLQSSMMSGVALAKKLLWEPARFIARRMPLGPNTVIQANSDTCRSSVYS